MADQDKMKRIEQLRPLSMEHHLSLVLANKAIKTATHGDEVNIKTLCQQIANEFERRWEAHFIKEELSIFTLFEDKYRSSLVAETPDDANLTDLLREQHNQMRTMSAEMHEGRTDQLAEFGRLLRDHTRLEERRLFPLVSDLFTTQELNLIALNTAH
jgi:hemerythrin-like domain-containing protein